MGTIVLEISGMTCRHCSAAVQKALLTVPGVTGAEVTIDPPMAVVSVEGAPPPASELVRAVEEEGYGARPAQG